MGGFWACVFICTLILALSNLSSGPGNTATSHELERANAHGETSSCFMTQNNSLLRTEATKYTLSHANACIGEGVSIRKLMPAS